MDTKIKEAYDKARSVLEKAYKIRDEAVKGYQADCKAKIEAADAELAKVYQAHNEAKVAYAREVVNEAS